MGFSVAFGRRFGGVLGGHVFSTVGLSDSGVVTIMVSAMVSVFAVGITVSVCVLALVTWAVLRVTGDGDVP